MREQQGVTLDELATKVGYRDRANVAGLLDTPSDGMRMRVETLVKLLDGLEAQIVIMSTFNDDEYILDGEYELDYGD